MVWYFSAQNGFKKTYITLLDTGWVRQVHILLMRFRCHILVILVLCALTGDVFGANDFGMGFLSSIKASMVSGIGRLIPISDDWFKRKAAIMKRLLFLSCPCMECSPIMTSCPLILAKHKDSKLYMVFFFKANWFKTVTVQLPRNGGVLRMVSSSTTWSS